MSYIEPLLSAFGTAADLATSLGANSAAQGATRKASGITGNAMDNALSLADLGTGRAMRQLLPWYQAGTNALPYYQQAAEAPYGVQQFNEQNGTSLSLANILQGYGPDQFLTEFGVDPRQYLQAGDFYSSPGYQWQESQGMAGMQQAPGGLLSNATLKALKGYNGNLARGSYGDWFNRDMANRKFVLERQYDKAQTAYNANRKLQLGALDDAADRNQTRTNNLASLARMGQDAATSRAGFAFKNGQTLADTLTKGGNTQADLTMLQGTNSAHTMGNINNAVQNGLSNALLMYGNSNSNGLGRQ